MGKRPKKKIVLCLVEGQSDINALSYGISELYDSIDSDYEVMFPILRDTNKTGGDITSKYGVKPENIERLIAQLFIDNYLKDYGLYPKDISEIIHIVDIDGVYIDDCSVIETKAGFNGKANYYDEEYIEAANIDSIIERNARKRENLNHLSNLESIKVGSKQVPYSVYYMACNLDHVISDDANIEQGSKCRNTLEFADKCQANDNFFVDFMQSKEIAMIGMTYKESWQYIKQGKNSLKRYTNINLLIDSLREKSDG